jgi:transposase InsO family protein
MHCVSTLQTYQYKKQRNDHGSSTSRGLYQRHLVDIMSPICKGKHFAIIAVDRLGKYVWSQHSTRSPTTKKRISLIKRIISKIRKTPKRILSDHGRQFISDEFIYYLSRHSIKCTHSSAYYSQGDGQTERRIQSFTTINHCKNFESNDDMKTLKALAGDTLNNCPLSVTMYSSKEFLQEATNNQTIPRRTLALEHIKKDNINTQTRENTKQRKPETFEKAKLILVQRTTSGLKKEKR